MVKQNLALPIGVINPSFNPRSFVPQTLKDAATFTRRLRAKSLTDCQLPNQLTDATGRITKPASW